MDKYGLRKKIIVYIKDEGSKLNVVTTTWKYVVGCEYFGLGDTIYWLRWILLLKINVVVDIEEGFMYRWATH